MDVLPPAPELQLPESFVEFLKKNGLDPSIYSSTNSVPRYVRLKPGLEAYIEEIEAIIKCDLEKVAWLPGFYSLPPHVQIANLKAYQEGKIYGIDAASGAAVLSLGITKGDHVLDICAAPGAKLCMILDLLGSSGSATGVDVAKHRLAACRTMLQKYSLGDRCRLFVADGTTFSLVSSMVYSDSQSYDCSLKENENVYKEWTSRRPWKERKKAAKGKLSTDSRIQDPDLLFYGRNSGVFGLSRTQVYKTLNESDLLYGYDKVLVDAECTHDGSIKHIHKFEKWGWMTLQRRMLDAERTDDLAILQLRLLTNGFRLLKVGGSLVYSTCSLTVTQNEDIVEQFLTQNASAELVEIDAAKNWPCRSGRLPKTLRFDPMTSKTSGLFVAKFTKLAI